MTNPAVGEAIDERPRGADPDGLGSSSQHGIELGPEQELEAHVDGRQVSDRPPLADRFS